ncbi:35361_t:CDS:10 [Racocetra persica]|uniref:35361_t:CDS:1 n=1 Tax=Racocetra persica TaxID=160502 RepID=A0ACA9KWB1_9GLOM|nr:35361_t:CDS:10 [Racocetra persica]
MPDIEEGIDEGVEEGVEEGHGEGADEGEGVDVTAPIDSSEEEEETDEEAAKEVLFNRLRNINQIDDISDDELELIGESRSRSEQNFKRLKRGRHESDTGQRGRSSYSKQYYDDMSEPEKLWQEVFQDLDEKYSYAFDNPEDMDVEPAEGLEAILDDGALKRLKMTSDDIRIKNTDLPERMLLRPDIDQGRKLTDFEIEEATKMISEDLAYFNEQRPTNQFMVAIKRVLKCLGQEFFEVPYIYTYRRDYIAEFDDDFSRPPQEILTRADLWHIYDLEYKYRLFIKKREEIRDTIKKYRIEDEYVKTFLSEASSIEALSDLHGYIHHQYSQQIVAALTSRRHVKKVSFYEECMSRNLDKLVFKIGVRVQEFGKSLNLGKKIHYPREIEDGPQDAAKEFASAYTRKAEFTNLDPVELALADAVKMLSQDIGFDPSFRKFVRRRVLEQGIIVVTPAPHKDIDINHECWPYRYLRKPISKFRHSGLFAKIMRGEDRGILKVKIELEREYDFLDVLEKHIVGDNRGNQTGQRWDRYRIDAVHAAYNKVLCPIIDIWIKARLKDDAEQWIMKQCMLGLESKLNVAPIKFTTRGRHPIECVCLDRTGRLLDNVRFNDLRDKESKDFYDFYVFMRDHKPIAIVLRSYDNRTEYLLENVQDVVGYYKNHGGEETPVIVIDDEVAKIYRLSSRGRHDYPDSEYNEVVRYCISLARTIQNPIQEYAALEESITSIKCHSLQSLLPKEKELECLQRAFINIVNEIGVDINDVINSPYKSDLLQYVSGLGPRKVDALYKRILIEGQTVDMDRRYGVDLIDVARREDLNKLYQLGPKVYANCAGFIRIRPKPADPFDDTRIHPTYYILARKMAADAFDMDDDEAEEELQQPNRRDFLKKLSAEPERLNDLILEDYAKSLSKYYESPTKLILHNIKNEMMKPYADPRAPFEIPTPDKIFEMITGETDETLYEGLIVCVKIYKIDDKALKCQLDSGLDGTITIGYVADHRIESQELRSRFHVDQQILAKVLSIDKIKFSVTLSCRPRDVNGKQTFQSQRSVDSDYDYDAEAREQTSKQTKPRNVITPKLHTRMIPHPMFKPFTYAEAQDYLSDKQPGSLVIRPSSKGYDYISITWKLYDNIYQHIDVVEKDKSGVVIGRRLEVENGKYVYSDLDELIVDYVEAKAQKVEALVNHPKFKDSEKSLNEFLDISLTFNPKQSEYGFCLDTKTPGWFLFMFKFKPGTQIDNWTGSIRPDGYKLKDQIYPTVIDLINGFKRNVSKNSSSQAYMRR